MIEKPTKIFISQTTTCMTRPALVSTITPVCQPSTTEDQVGENGSLFSCPPNNGNPATIFYRPHETWTSRADWQTQLPLGEDVTSMLIQILEVWL